MSERMSERSKLNRLSRVELIELIYDIRKENVELTSRCKTLEDQVKSLREREGSAREERDVDGHLGLIDERLDGLEDILQDVRDRLAGQFSAP